MSIVHIRQGSVPSRFWAGVKARWRSLDVLVPLLGIILLVDIMTFSAGFGGNDDPGTYTAQSWAVLNWHELAHYTYWYDHPPLGWLQIALYAWLTNGFGRSDIDTLMASELMVIAQLVSCALIFMLMRRLGFNRWFGAVAVVLFALSPLAIQYQKMAFLDNLSVPWLLASMVFAASPRRSLAAAFGAGLCMTAVCLTKETAAIGIVAVLYLLWQNYGKGFRVWGIMTFMTTTILTAIFYIFMAVFKNELMPGPGHVSLWDALVWQLGRDGGFEIVHTWLSLDRLLLYMALAALPVGLVVRRMRPIAVCFVVMCLMLARGGYIPAPYIIGMLPFAALLVAGALGSVWPGWSRVTVATRSKWQVWARRAVVAVATVVAVVVSAPSWAQTARTMTPRDEVWYYQRTMEWVQQNVPHDAVIAVDDNMWVDLREQGYTNVVWFYKLDLDPEIHDKYVPDSIGYKGIDYIVLKDFYWGIADDTPNSVVIQAKENGVQVAAFGNTQQDAGVIVAPYDVYKIEK